MRSIVGWKYPFLSVLPIHFGFELLVTGDPSSFGHNLVGFVHFGSAPIHLV